MSQMFEVLVVGGGHAGIEAAYASARMGVETALLTMEIDAIGRMSCNPAIGGVAKGQIVRDIDALGGLMGQLADQAGIHFRMLNESKGPAVWGPRAQQDMDLYATLAQKHLAQVPHLSLLEGELARFEARPQGGFILHTLDGRTLEADKVIVTSGTFLGAVMHVGEEQSRGGRVGEASADELSQTIKNLGLRTRRLKTGTPARLAESSLDQNLLEVQAGDEQPWAFSFRTDFVPQNKIHCWITRTTSQTHDLLRSGFDRSPMFTGRIQGLGPRYCPSIEDKINRFGDKESHQLFLEPEGMGSGRIYVNGFSSSLPKEVQDAALRSIPGLANCEVLRYGYAVEYDSVLATDLWVTMEHKKIPGLYFAGQVNGTSGYEEAAGQGLMAGINAALSLRSADPFILSRADSYIGVMLDDLVSMDIPEPYRMFTSRAEYRLRLRHDNAEARLMQQAQTLGLIDSDCWDKFRQSRERIEKCQQHLRTERVHLNTANEWLASLGEAPLKESPKAAALLKRPGASIEPVLEMAGCGQDLTRFERLHVFAEELYSGFFERQNRDVERQQKLENLRLDPNYDYHQVPSLSMEARIKLCEEKPLSLGQAKRIPGVRPTDISILIYHLNAHKQVQA